MFKYLSKNATEIFLFPMKELLRHALENSEAEAGKGKKMRVHKWGV